MSDIVETLKDLTANIGRDHRTGHEFIIGDSQAVVDATRAAANEITRLRRELEDARNAAAVAYRVCAETRHVTLGDKSCHLHPQPEGEGGMNDILNRLLCLIGIHDYVPEAWFTCNHHDKDMVCRNCYRLKRPIHWPAFWRGFRDGFGSIYSVAIVSVSLVAFIAVFSP